ncbi:MAG: hypothetical protein CL484_03155 [Acidobacteria bacterium]|nr:hypothetical protein [Acidobacteriota bacterium]|tara:strand:- start:543 stop:788 length:246 start_codon:yes stop_codon:yes gene_type:complete
MPELFTTQRAIEFALDLEDNENIMAENAAMMVTLQAYGLEWGDQNEILWLLPDGAWWLEDNRLTPVEREKLRQEYEQREAE